MALSAPYFDWVRDLVRRESAIVLGPGKEYLVEARLTPVARTMGLPDVDRLVDSVRRNPDPARTRRIVEALTTNETSWFRDIEPFTALSSTVLPSLLDARAPHERLQIWSAACSAGQEPYTIAMVLQDALPDAAARVAITATDLSREMVERTRAGRFSQLEMNRGLPAAMLVRHFTRVEREWEISREMRGMVTVHQCNLAVPLPRFGPFDVIYLRNVLIYFDLSTKQDILRRIRQVMRPDGWLFLGAAETTIGIDDSWQRIPVGRGSAYRPVKGQ
jgi:chemotaxis protein methyltransferase CheR